MTEQREESKKTGGNFLALILAGALVIFIAVAGAFLIKKYAPTKERMDLNKYFQLESEDALAILVGDAVIEEQGIVLEGRPYVSTKVIKKYINDRFYWDSEEKLFIYTMPMENITAHAGENQYQIDRQTVGTDYQIVKVENEVAYVALEYIQQYTAMEYEYLKEPNRVHITCEFGEVPVAEAKKKGEVRYQAGPKSGVLTEVQKGDLLYIVDEGDRPVENWTKVRTLDGFIGYIKDNRLKEASTVTLTTDFEESVYSSLTKDYTINMAWHQVTNTEANSQVVEKLAAAKGVTTISPTWFAIKDNEGNIRSLASSDYVNYCHQKGIEVWGLVENITYEGQIDITSVLNKTSSRQNLVNQLVAKAIQYDLDGINVDIESLPGEAGDGFIQFVRELSIMCRRNNIVLSVDNYVPMAYNKNYNRKEQGIVADYVIIMGYDEHFAGSETAGSVASIGYVKNGIEKTLEEVPANKVINAVPFYTRLWCTDNSGKVTSSALGMNEADRRLAKQGVTPEWDEETAQYYGEFQGSDGVYQVWLEEERSIEEKAKLIKEYNLAGVASWRLGYERDEIWEVLLKYVN